MLDESQQMLSEGVRLHHEAEGLTGEGDHRIVHVRCEN